MYPLLPSHTHTSYTPHRPPAAFCLLGRAHPGCHKSDMAHVSLHGLHAKRDPPTADGGRQQLHRRIGTADREAAVISGGLDAARKGVSVLESGLAAAMRRTPGETLARVAGSPPADGSDATGVLPDEIWAAIIDMVSDPWVKLIAVPSVCRRLVPSPITS